MKKMVRRKPTSLLILTSFLITNNIKIKATTGIKSVNKFQSKPRICITSPIMRNINVENTKPKTNRSNLPNCFKNLVMRNPGKKYIKNIKIEIGKYNKASIISSLD